MPVDDLRVGPVAGDGITFSVDGQSVAARAGETLAAALMASGHVGFALARDGSPRGVFCGMGACFGCAVTVDGRRGARACLTLVRRQMAVATR